MLQQMYPDIQVLQEPREPGQDPEMAKRDAFSSLLEKEPEWAEGPGPAFSGTDGHQDEMSCFIMPAVSAEIVPTKV
jgi:hypothetical protein